LFCFLMMLLALSVVETLAQVHRCGTVEYENQLVLKNPSLVNQFNLGAARVQKMLQCPEYNKTNSVVVIPVVIHLLYNTSSPDQSLSDAQISSQIAVLNEDYSRNNADTSKTPNVWKKTASATNFQFTLAKRDPKGLPSNGIVRKITTNTSFGFGSDDERFSARGGDDAWNSDQYLNIWVVPSISNGGGSEVLGFCTPPGSDKSIDGVTVGYKYFGRNSKSIDYNLGRTVTHEVGHWFGLYHVWGVNSGDCASSDSISDTPTQSISSSGKPVFPLTDVCTPSFPGVMFMNFLDYSDDASMNLFTNDQVARMNAVLNYYRPLIKTSPGGLAGLSNNVYQPAIAVFPNPVKDFLKIQADFFDGGPLHLSVYTLFGQCLRKESIWNGSANIDLSDTPDGCYLLKFESGNQSVYKKIIVAKD
jgi:hypothetical protein